MAINGNARLHLRTDGDVILDQLYNLPENPASPGMVETVSLDAGVPNNIPVPSIPGYSVKSVLIKPLQSNLLPYTLAMNGGMSNLWLHATSPSFIALDAVPFGSNLVVQFLGTVKQTYTFVWI
jgi:hypothetical protein